MIAQLPPSTSLQLTVVYTYSASLSAAGIINLKLPPAVAVKVQDLVTSLHKPAVLFPCIMSTACMYYIEEVSKATAHAFAVLCC